ncbi:response regulator transcription factor [Rhizobium sp. YJ-22]|uniref:helix-turn-helix transcriptional regulator n=1 Tax=Rhizobium sp. YJ-22 TaxID=3037556 RepID=UPI002412999A|nr:response regulator transcription factor [Rhizobium sp. YJ-22]MDG3577953.1 response regulator transcription factor [Rhizobium sp. YJ-22]
MFMVASRVVNPNKSGSLAAASDTLLVLARTDLFSECLVETLGKKFPFCDVVSLDDSNAIIDHDDSKVRLALFYKIPTTELHAAVQAVRSLHPEASIGLVIDAIDMMDTNLDTLVETRTIDGILPLNLRMDVFMAAVDLLMKGGEHFPSALMSRLRASKTPLEKTQAMIKPTALTAPSRLGEAYVLTTREVQILDLLCKGTQNKIIADKLNLSENTVKVHVRNIYKKMNVRNRTEAASRFFLVEGGGELPPGLRN